MDLQTISQAFRLLAERLEYADAPSVALLVSGGTALNVLGLISRTTKDVDVVALVKTDGSHEATLSRADPLPDYLAREVWNVAQDLGLPDDWVNPGPASLVDLGLPEGCLRRSELHVFGPRLRVYFVGRVDQIHFKLYAAVDQGGGRHLADLLALEANPTELLAAARWSMTHDVSHGFRHLMIQTLRQITRDDVADQL